MGYVVVIRVVILLLTPPFAAFIISVAFNMGTDTATILQNPIGQPMATVRRQIPFHSQLTEPGADPFQQSRNEGHSGGLEFDHHNHVRSFYYD